MRAASAWDSRLMKSRYWGGMSPRYACHQPLPPPPAEPVSGGDSDLAADDPTPAQQAQKEFGVESSAKSSSSGGEFGGAPAGGGSGGGSSGGGGSGGGFGIE